MAPRQENRQFPRRYALYRAKYTIASGTFRDPISNVSKGGIFIHTHRSVENGQRVCLRFPIIAFDRKPCVTGTVVRSLGQGFAVEFDSPIEA